MPMSAKTTPDSSRSQTLDRGLSILEFIASTDEAPSIDQVSEHLGLGRSVTYRIIRTLEDHRLVVRDANGKLGGGNQLLALAANVRSDLRASAMPALSQLANTLEMTSFLVVPDADEVVTIEVVEPSRTAAHIAYRPGTRHPRTKGAPGIALLAADPQVSNARSAVKAARKVGWAYSESEVIQGMASVAAPVTTQPGEPVAAIAVVHLAANFDAQTVAPAVLHAARSLENKLSSSRT